MAVPAVKTRWQQRTVQSDGLFNFGPAKSPSREAGASVPFRPDGGGAYATGARGRTEG